MAWFTKAKDPMSVRQAELDREIEVIQRRISDLSARPLPRFERCRPEPIGHPALWISSAACRSGADSHECGGLAVRVVRASRSF